MDICRILITWTSLTKACPPSSRLPKMNIPLASGETIYMIFGPGPPSFVFISPHISGVSLNMTCQTPQPFIKSSNTRFLSDSSPIIALPCHSVTHCQCLGGWGFDWVVRKIWLEDMEGDPGNPAAKLKSHRNAQDMDEREWVSWPVCILVST